MVKGECFMPSASRGSMQNIQAATDPHSMRGKNKDRVAPTAISIHYTAEATASFVNMMKVASEMESKMLLVGMDARPSVLELHDSFNNLSRTAHNRKKILNSIKKPAFDRDYKMIGPTSLLE
ncbi:hypothetical protein BX616_000122, partial [Lobosporangium transversale]